MGCSAEWEGVVPWVSGYDPKVFVSFDDGTLKKFRELVGRGFTREGSHREIFNSVSWLWTLSPAGEPEGPPLRAGAAPPLHGLRRPRGHQADRRGGGQRSSTASPSRTRSRSCFADIVTKDITKLVNIAVLKHNEDSGVTWAAKNIALGVTTNKVRFHIDFCEKAIPEILAAPCIKDKTVLHIGEAAKISTGQRGRGARSPATTASSSAATRWPWTASASTSSRRSGRPRGSDRSATSRRTSRPARGRALGTDDLARIDLRELRA